MEDAVNESKARNNVTAAIQNHPNLNILAGIWSYNAPAIADVVTAIRHGRSLAELGPLRRRDGESYEAFIERIASHPLARRVKLADLEDNMDLKRIKSPTQKDLDRITKYHKAWVWLRGAVKDAPSSH